jgi:hypothetical protein
MAKSPFFVAMRAKSDRVLRNSRAFHQLREGVATTECIQRKKSFLETNEGVSTLK